MSRRHRLEEERARNVRGEEDEEEDKLKLQKQRIYAPVIWERMGTGYRIQDLKEENYEQVQQMIREHYIPEEVLCRNAEMKDEEEAIESFLYRCLFHMKDTSSIITIHETSGELAGALILTVVSKLDFSRVFSRAMLMNGVAHKKITTLTNELNRKMDVFAELECELFLRYYALCVKPEYRRKGLGFQMMKTGVTVARSMHVPVIMGIFSNHNLQKLAKKIGMKVLKDIYYTEWRDRGGELIFDDPGAGNYTCALMAGKVPPPEPPEPPKPEEVAAKEGKKPTRKEKRAKSKT